MGWADVITADQVVDIKTFCDFARQTAGVPYPTKANLSAAKKEVDLLFEQYPMLTWQGLCRLPVWAKSKKNRYPHALALLRAYRWAYRDGFLPELDVSYQEAELEKKIEQALLVEKSPEWRRRLMEARGEAREKTYRTWASRVDL